MKVDKYVPLTKKERKIIANHKRFVKLTPLFIIVGFFTAFAGLTLCIIGGADFEENKILLYIGLPLLLFGALCFFNLKFRYLNLSLYNKLIYRLLIESFNITDYSFDDKPTWPKNYLISNEIANVEILNISNESFSFNKNNSKVTTINITRSISKDSNKDFINEMFSVSKDAIAGKNKIAASLSVKGVLIEITNLINKFDSVIDIRSLGSDIPSSMLFNSENRIEKDDFSNKFEVYMSSLNSYDQINDNLKSALLKLEEKGFKFILLIKSGTAFIFIKDHFIYPYTIIRRDNEVILENYKKCEDFYLLINNLIDSLSK